MADLRVPEELKPADGRFGSGPSKIRPEALESLVKAAPRYLGTSHRHETVRAVVRRVRDGLAALWRLPDGYEVALGNGGTTSFWDAASFGLIEEKSQHLCFGEFSSRFAGVVGAAPHLAAPELISSEAGTHPEPESRAGVDAYALTHNETSTGVAMEVLRPRDASGEPAAGLVLVDATSGAGGLRVDPAEFDCYYFAPQKCFGGDGGLWLAVLSPLAIDRIRRISRSGRFIPGSLDLALALESSRLEQTCNTPALATLWLLADQIEWFNDNGGIEFSAGRCDRSAEILYGWAERSSYARPFVSEPGDRSHVVATVDFDASIDALDLAGVLRQNGIVDTDPYRKLGRNQLRVAMFPAIEPADVEALTHSVDWIVERLAS